MQQRRSVQAAPLYRCAEWWSEQLCWCSNLHRNKTCSTRAGQSYVTAFMRLRRVMKMRKGSQDHAPCRAPKGGHQAGSPCTQCSQTMYRATDNVPYEALVKCSCQQVTAGYQVMAPCMLCSCSCRLIRPSPEGPPDSPGYQDQRLHWSIVDTAHGYAGWPARARARARALHELVRLDPWQAAAPIALF